MKFKIFIILTLLLFPLSVLFADKSILYISDSVHMSDYFNTKYVDMLQSLIDDDFGKGAINVSKVTKFDMNTTQCLELCDVLFSKKHQDTLILNFVKVFFFFDNYRFISVSVSYVFGKAIQIMIIGITDIKY